MYFIIYLYIISCNIVSYQMTVIRYLFLDKMDINYFKPSEQYYINHIESPKSKR